MIIEDNGTHHLRQIPICRKFIKGDYNYRVSGKSGKSQVILFFLEKSGNLDKKSGKSQGNIFENRYCRKSIKISITFKNVRVKIP